MRIPRSFAALGLFIFLSRSEFAQHSLLQLNPPQNSVDLFDPRPLDITIPPGAQSQTKITSLDLLTLKDLHGLQISPDGKYVAFVLGQAVLETNSYRSALCLIGTEEGAKPLCLGSAGPPHWDLVGEWLGEAPFWSRDSRHLYYRLRTKGIWQVWRWELKANAKPLQITHAPQNVLSAELSPDRERLILTVQAAPRSPAQLDALQQSGVLYDESIESFHSRPFLDSYEIAHASAPEVWIHDLKVNSEHKASSQELTDLAPWQSDLSEKQLTSTSTQTLTGHHISSSKRSPDRRRVAFMEYLDDPSTSEWFTSALFVKPIRGGTSKRLDRGMNLVTEPYWWSSDGEFIYYQAYQSGSGRSSKIMVVPSDGGEPQVVVSGQPGEMIENCTTDDHNELFACSRETNKTPAEIILVDRKQRTTRTLFDPNPQFRRFQLGKSFRLDVRSKYEDDFHGTVVLPPNYVSGERYPLVITTYANGDGFLRGGVGDEYPIQVFAASGFIVLDFSVGKDRNIKDGDFEKAILEWDSPVDGMRAAVERLDEVGLIDKSKVAITGLSHGQEMVQYAISHAAFPKVAISSGAGFWDPFSYYFLAGIGKGWAKQWGLSGSLKGESLARWLKLSATLNADHITAPLLINAADSEYVLGLDEVSVMNELHKPLEMFIFANEFHVKNQPKHRYEIYERNLDWLKFWLQDEEDASPSKKEQYERWRHLRQSRPVPATVSRLATSAAAKD